MKQLKKLVARTVRKSIQRNETDRRQGDSARGRGDWSAAASAYGRHLSRFPKDFDIWVQMGHALKESGRYDDAEGAYQEADRLNGANADLFLCRGHLAKLRGDMRAAVDFYNRSFLIDSNPDAARELATRAAVTCTDPGSGSLLELPGALERFEDGFLIGWVANPDGPARPAEVEILLDGNVIATAIGLSERPDLRHASVSAEALGFRIDLRGRLDLTSEPQLFGRLRGGEEALSGSPLTARMSESARRWLARNDHLSPAAQTELAERIRSEARGHRLSVIVATHQAKATDLDRTIDSVLAQWSQDWELLLLHDPALDAALARRLKRQAAKDRRVKIVAAPSDGVAAQIDAGLAAASGDYLLPIPPSTVLEPDAVFRILDAARERPGLIYWDEAMTGKDPSSIERFILRPAFSHDHLLAFHGFLGDIAVCRETALTARRKQALPERAADLDFLLRCVESAGYVAHVPAVLTRVRTKLERETGASQPPVDTIRQTIDDHLQRLDVNATTAPGLRSGAWSVEPALYSARTLVIILASDDLPRLKHCVEAVLKTTLRSQDDIMVVFAEGANQGSRDYLSAMKGRILVEGAPAGTSLATHINTVIAKTGETYDHIALLEDYIQPRRADWLHRLCAISSMPGAGTVSPLLVDHAGFVQGGGLAKNSGQILRRNHGSPLKSGKLRNRGWNDTLLARHNASAAGDCMVLRRQLFVSIGGLDSAMPRGLDSVDLSLRIGTLGLQILVEPQVALRSLALPRLLAPRGAFSTRWADWLGEVDLHDNPLRYSDFSETQSSPSEAWPPRLRSAISAPASPDLAQHRLIPPARRDAPLQVRA